jgi:hypothetical protein
MNELTDKERIVLIKLLGYYETSDSLLRSGFAKKLGGGLLPIKMFNPDKIKGSEYLKDLWNSLSKDEQQKVIKICIDKIEGEGFAIFFGYMLNKPFEVCKAILKVKGFEDES